MRNRWRRRIAPILVGAVVAASAAGAAQAQLGYEPGESGQGGEPVAIPQHPLPPDQPRAAQGPNAAADVEAVRPDDRPGGRGPGVASKDTPAAIVTTASGFDWADAGIGAGAAFGLMLAVGGASLITRRVRRTSVPVH